MFLIKAISIHHKREDFPRRDGLCFTRNSSTPISERLRTLSYCCNNFVLPYKTSLSLYLYAVKWSIFDIAFRYVLLVLSFKVEAAFWSRIPNMSQKKINCKILFINACFIYIDFEKTLLS